MPKQTHNRFISSHLDQQKKKITRQEPTIIIIKPIEACLKWNVIKVHYKTVKCTNTADLKNYNDDDLSIHTESTTRRAWDDYEAWKLLNMSHIMSYREGWAEQGLLAGNFNIIIVRLLFFFCLCHAEQLNCKIQEKKYYFYWLIILMWLVDYDMLNRALSSGICGWVFWERREMNGLKWLLWSKEENVDFKQLFF